MSHPLLLKVNNPPVAAVEHVSLIVILYAFLAYLVYVWPRWTSWTLLMRSRLGWRTNWTGRYSTQCQVSKTSNCIQKSNTYNAHFMCSFVHSLCNWDHAQRPDWGRYPYFRGALIEGFHCFITKIICSWAVRVGSCWGGVPDHARVEDNHSSLQVYLWPSSKC